MNKRRLAMIVGLAAAFTLAAAPAYAAGNGHGKDHGQQQGQGKAKGHDKGNPPSSSAPKKAEPTTAPASKPAPKPETAPGPKHAEEADGCDHGATGKPCRPDPQPEHGKDCVKHGNHGGINEDHCSGGTTTDDPQKPEDPQKPDTPDQPETPEQPTLTGDPTTPPPAHVNPPKATPPATTPPAAAVPQAEVIGTSATALAFTGSNTWRLVGLAVALVLSGGVLLTGRVLSKRNTA